MKLKYLIICLILPSLAFADFITDLNQYFKNFASIFEPLIIMLLVVSFVCGIYFIFKGVGLLKKFGMSGYGAQQGELAGPIVFITVGIILIYLPTSTNIMQRTMFGDSSSDYIFQGQTVRLNATGEAAAELLGYSTSDTSSELFGSFINTLFLYIQFIGFLAFVRGWFLVVRAGNPGVQPGAVGKGFIHIIGGIIAINAVPMITIVQNTIIGS